MSLKNAVIQVGVSPTLLSVEKDRNYEPGNSIIVQAEAECFVGGSEVTAATGIKIVAGAVITIDLTTGELLYGITSTGNAIVRVMQAGI